MPARTSATSAVVTLSVAVAVLGHALAGGAVAAAAVPQLLALAAVCWLLGQYVEGRRWSSVALLAGVQLVVHLTLASEHPEPPAVAAAAPADHHHHAHEMPMPPAPESGLHDGITGAFTMAAAHLVVLLAGVVLISRAHDWATRVLRILARLVPELPAGLISIPTLGPRLTGVPELPRVLRQWSTNVLRRGPPGVQVLPASVLTGRAITCP